jgi:hypothetical protein
MRVRGLVLPFVVASQLVAAWQLSAADLIQNGSFESNGGPNSNLFPGWTIVDEAGGSGTWLAQTGTTGPVTPEFDCGNVDVQPPPAGSFAAMTTQSAAGAHILYQDVVIPAGTRPTLSFQYYIRSASDFFAPDSLSRITNPNQQFRVDIVEPSADLFTVNVLQSVLHIGPGNPRESGYHLQTASLAGLGGRMVRIRFFEVDNQACFNVGIDDVRLDDALSPATSIIRFHALPSVIRFANATTLTWTTQNATAVEIDNGIGPVPVSGSRAVSLQEDTTFILTATGPSGTAQSRVTVSVRSPGPEIRFSANPGFVQQGGAATLSWTTTDATTVSIDNGIGDVPVSGSLTVRPSGTTEYTLTATGGGVMSAARATVFVDPGDVPIVSVTSFPNGIVQAAGSGPAQDQFVLSNLGSVDTSITLNQSGDFFTVSPAAFTLPARSTQIVTITTTTQPAGRYEGAVLPRGMGVPADLRIPVRLFVAVPPTGTVAPTTAVARTEIAAPANENPSGSVSFTNQGTGTLQGLAFSDVAWLIPQSDVITIGPGETKTVTFTTNRALRPDAASLAGAAIATLTLVYLDFPSSPSALRASISGSGSATGKNSISVSIVDVVKPGATPGSPPPLGAGDLALFAPGLSQRFGSSGDLVLSVVGNAVSDLKLYFGAAGTSPVLGSLDQLAPNSGLTLPSVLQSVFATSASSGSVQVRSMDVSRVALAALQTNTNSPVGSYITALPTFRSDRSAGAGENVHLTGVEKGTGRSTNLFIQEVAGVEAAVRIEFLDASGNVINARAEETMAAFSLLSLPDSVPAGAASVRIANTSSGAARIVAYAIVVDTISQDAWTIVDSQSGAVSSLEQFIPVVTPPINATTTNRLSILNPGSEPVEIAIDSRPSAPLRRRAARSTPASGGAQSLAVSNMTIGPQQTVVTNVESLSSGYLRITGSRPIVLSARAISTAAGRAGTFGTTLPVFPTAAALAMGQSRRFGGVEDANRPTIAAFTPVTYRSNLGLIESSGQPAVVRLTLRYTFSAGTKTTAQGLSIRDIPLPANNILVLNEFSRIVIGPSRDGFGDLRNMQLDVEVISGDGRVLPFLQTIDNGSSDSTIRTE